MILSHLTPEQELRQSEFRSFADCILAPHADRFDVEQAIDREIITALAGKGFIGASLSQDFGGLGIGDVEYGLLTEELGRGCQSIRNFVAVEDMVAHSVAKWGTPAQRGHWLPRITAGETVAAFALTEPDVGSDAAAVETVATRDGDAYVLTGTKKWISFAQIADLFLVFAKLEGQHTAFLVERDTPGLSVSPVQDLLGLRGSMLGRIDLKGCRIPSDNLVGSPGLGLAFVASSALDLGRYSTAWGSVGLAQVCLEACTEYAGQRRQFGTQIRNHQLVQSLLADMVTDTLAARLLCFHAGVSKERHESDAVHHTLMAKYRSSTVAVKVASDAVQIHGAQGIGSEKSVQRHYRDAKVMEIIEGTTQIQQSILGPFADRVARQARQGR
ncbi:acyl-CoA dehydrogenase family protein [Streptomyces sp. NPDC088251]|uniref:acyl-CoA dehydrogenase family protein n=1 Tax=unclassified Streptomyces TaxID=2593676 RepID=UPI00382E6FD1